ncbi:MAG: hypothetical protein M1368_06905 [Thaumarchaeota archaeon]|nr:hypothetical protein [Nitrososphaerota archaeon]
MRTQAEQSSVVNAVGKKRHFNDKGQRYLELNADLRRWHESYHKKVPSCFNCGPLRLEGDGLRIFPGILAGRDVVAPPWTPAESLGDSTGVVKSEFI